MHARALATSVFFLSTALFTATPMGSKDNEGASGLPIQVSICQLETNGNAYDHKEVEVRGRIYFGKFDFIIDAACEPHGTGVWLDLGGDVPAPRRDWLLWSLSKQKGADVQVEGVAIPLSHDSLLDQFLNDIVAMRFRKPNGDNCGSECFYYQVTATVRGTFFSGTKGRFGMDGCCHLLVVEKVVDLSSKRTGVPAGGEFRCTSDRWQPSPEELKTLSAIPGCSLRADFRNCYAVLARHWGDDIKPMGGLNYDGPWMSRDMTRCYKFVGGWVSNPGQPTTIKPSSTVVREVCNPISPPEAASDHVYCDSFQSIGQEDRTAAAALQEKVDAGSESWRSSDMAQVGWLAFEEASKRWTLAVPVHVELAKCESSPPGTSGDGIAQQWGYCTWIARDEMQEITVTLHKPGFLLKTATRIEQVAWIATEVEANLCHTRPDSR
jgi:hypothetical protein